jgi:hypothetical protein
MERDGEASAITVTYPYKSCLEDFEYDPEWFGGQPEIMFPGFDDGPRKRYKGLSNAFVNVLVSPSMVRYGTHRQTSQHETSSYPNISPDFPIVENANTLPPSLDSVGVPSFQRTPGTYLDWYLTLIAKDDSP